MTSSQIRQSFLDFFKSKAHTIVPSASLMPDSPNLLFTNAGMNQFVPIFLGQQQADVSKWAGAIPGRDTRAADTQKCIRAGGKHNDLEDVGLDTYHHTFFEMLGNWSFGDYFKKEAIDWAWELVTEIWKFPKERLYATVYKPDPSKGDPSELDQEAWDIWAEKYRAAGLDPQMHIVFGNKKDNFWMMGETGPCGPCSELHVDLTPEDRTLEMEQRGATLVNQGDARCIEIWNLVFIQFNANPDGTFSPLPAKHVDTGMGFERVASIIQGTKGFSDFKSAKISNYETDIFRPIFDALEELSGKQYTSTLPPKFVGDLNQQIRDIAECIPAGRVLTYGELGAMCRPPTGGQQVGQVISHSMKDFPWWRIVTQDGEFPVERKDSQEANEQKVRLEAENVRVSSQGRVYMNDHALEREQFSLDIAFRVIADHIRTLGFAIADGIQPGNTDRNYVLRRILRRAIRYGRTLGFHEPFFYKLVGVLADTMGDVLPEIRTRKQHVQETIRIEEEAFNKTLDRGIELFNAIAGANSLVRSVFTTFFPNDTNRGLRVSEVTALRRGTKYFDERALALLSQIVPLKTQDIDTLQTGPERLEQSLINVRENPALKQRALETLCIFPADKAFELYDTYGFPLDLTELMARERGLTVDTAGFNKLMEEQRARARAAQKKQVIELSQIETTTPTCFVGFDKLETKAKVLEVVGVKDKTAVVLDTSSAYAEMGGQVGDTGELSHGGQLWRVVNTQKSGNTWLHFISDPGAGDDRVNRKSPIVNAADVPAVGSEVELTVDRDRRRAIERHHTVTHLLHWAIHEVASREASQKGSFVGPDKLTFDFNAQPLAPQQVADIEKLVNERILENADVSWTEGPHAEIKGRKDVMQFFGEKYGDIVRVVQIGGRAKQLDGYSMELCGGTHTRATGEIGLFRIVGESAIAAGVRRIEAVAGLPADDVANQQLQLIKNIAAKINSPVHELEKKIEAMLAQQKELEKQLKATQQKEAAETARQLVFKARGVNNVRAIVENLGPGDGDYLQSIADALKGQFQGVVVLGAVTNGAVALVATVSPDFTPRIQAGKLIQAIAPIVGGKGGGRPDNARGGGKDAGKLEEALQKAVSLLA
jgi:alanyl-tRNA synthetase